MDADDKEFNDKFDEVDANATVCSSIFICCNNDIRSFCDNDCIRMFFVSTALLAGNHSSDILNLIKIKRKEKIK